MHSITLSKFLTSQHHHNEIVSTENGSFNINHFNTCRRVNTCILCAHTVYNTHWALHCKYCQCTTVGYTVPSQLWVSQSQLFRLESSTVVYQFCGRKNGIFCFEYYINFEFVLNFFLNPCFMRRAVHWELDEPM